MGVIIPNYQVILLGTTLEDIIELRILLGMSTQMGEAVVAFRAVFQRGLPTVV